MSQIEINDVILKFKDSTFTGNQWEQVASWVLNGGGESAAESARIALEKAVEAVNAATNANRDAIRAKSYAVGDTGTREGEDTDNAKYYCEQTRRISGGEFIVSINGEGADETGNFTLDAEKVGAIDKSEKGAAGGVAELDDEGKVPEEQLPEEMTPAAHAETHKKGGSDPLAAADIDAAPAGYGLGGGAVGALSNDWNNAIDCGFYAGKVNAPENGIWYFGTIARINETEKRIVQTAFRNQSSVSDTAPLLEAKRYGLTSDGVTFEWAPWEWVNPPMLLGVEYRTTERHNGKPVYAKLVDCGEMPSQGIKTFTHGIANIERCVRDLHEMKYPTRADSYNLPFMTGSFTVNASFGVASVTIYDSASSHAGYHCYSTLYYTKTTD